MKIKRGNTYDNIKIEVSETINGVESPKNLTDFTAKVLIYDSLDDDPVMDISLDIPEPEAGVILFAIDSEKTAALNQRDYYYEIEIRREGTPDYVKTLPITDSVLEVRN